MLASMSARSVARIVRPVGFSPPSLKDRKPESIRPIQHNDAPGLGCIVVAPSRIAGPSIQAATSLDAMGEFIGADVYQSYLAVNENEPRVTLI
jgi:hypothetical protein